MKKASLGDFHKKITQGRSLIHVPVLSGRPVEPSGQPQGPGITTG
jgi:hypothetical protein